MLTNQKESSQLRSDIHNAERCMEKSPLSVEAHRKTKEESRSSSIESKYLESPQKRDPLVQRASEKIKPADGEKLISTPIENLVKLLQRSNQDVNESLKILELSTEEKVSVLKRLNTAPQEEKTEDSLTEETQFECYMGR